ncbi:MAG: prepilin peptidase [Anaerolineales bacterium]|nr:prepilin peptidase [Anaerolineales bacterium]
MILLAVVLGWISAVVVNGLADNLLREEAWSLRSGWIPRCQYCDSPRKFLDWSAVISTLFFSGRCRRCSAPRPLRDLLTEAFLWLGFPLILTTGRADIHALLTGGMILSAGILFSIIDFEHRAVIGEAVLFVSLALLLDGLTYGVDYPIRMLIGGLTGFAVFLLLFLLGKALAFLFGIGHDIEPLGFGDVILAAFIGIITGWPAILLAIFVSIFLGGFAGLGMALILAVRRSPLKNATMAYGPYLLTAGLLIFFFGTPFLGGILNILSAF